MDRYLNIKNNLLELAQKDADIKAVVLIGSSTRDTVKADEYSDIDVVIATEDMWLCTIRWNLRNCWKRTCLMKYHRQIYRNPSFPIW